MWRCNIQSVEGISSSTVHFRIVHYKGQCRSLTPIQMFFEPHRSSPTTRFPWPSSMVVPVVVGGRRAALRVVGGSSRSSYLPILRVNMCRLWWRWRRRWERGLIRLSRITVVRGRLLGLGPVPLDAAVHEMSVSVQNQTVTYQQRMSSARRPKKTRQPVIIQRPTRWKKDSGLHRRMPWLST
jgi:hypothetical protein